MLVDRSRSEQQVLEASPFRHPGWVKFNESKWGLTAKELSFQTDGSSLPKSSIVIYLGRNGKIRPVPHQLYHPVIFESTNTKWPYRIENQWLKASAEIAGQMREIGIAGKISLNIPVPDVRPWQWNRFRAETLYTHVIDFPFDLANTSSTIRSSIRKGEKSGYSCERTDDAAAVMSCVRATEERQGFTHGLTDRNVASLQQLMGEESCRFYVCRANDGSPVASEVVLVGESGTEAIEWLAGSKLAHYSHGPHQLLNMFIYHDLQADGLQEVNLAGSNLPRLSSYKAEWGGRLAQYYSVTQDGGRAILADCRSLVRTCLTSMRG